VDPGSTLHALDTTQVPFTNEGYAAQYVSGQQQQQFDQYRYTHTTKPAQQFDNPSSTMYYQQEFPAVTQYYPDPNEESVTMPPGTLSGPSNYQGNFFFSST
jgi:hypothetical protein